MRSHTASSTYEPELSSVAKARSWAVDQLSQHIRAPERLADVELVISELVTNAIKAGATEVSIELDARPMQVLISIADDADGQVAIRSPSPSAPGGRGLPIVAALSSDWGVDVQSSGKRVWALLPTDVA